MAGAFIHVEEKDKTAAVEKLISESTPDRDFFFMAVLSVLMATFGFLIDSIAVVIGSMLIAPLLSPVLSLSLGVVISDQKLMARSFSAVVRAAVWGIGGAAVVTLLFGGGIESETAVTFLNPSFLYIVVAIIAGIAATYALVKPELNEAFPGTVIAVTLVPPVALIGMSIAQWNSSLISSALLVFSLNIIGIVFASMIMFSIMNFHNKRIVAKKTIKEEEKRLEKEEKEIEKEHNEQ